MSRRLCVILKIGSVTISMTEKNMLAEVIIRYATGMYKVCSACDFEVTMHFNR
jgi:hypothetical protein